MRDSVLSAITQMRQDDPQPARHSTHAVPVGQLPDGSHVRPIPARHATTRRLTRVVTAVMGVAALVAAVALAGWSYGRSQITRNYRADAAAVSRIISAPDAHTYHQQAPNGMRVTYVVTDQHNAALVVVDHIHDPGKNRSYQLWTVRSTGGKSTFVPDQTFTNPRSPIILHTDIRSAAALGITNEPVGGSPQPTTNPFAVQSVQA